MVGGQRWVWVVPCAMALALSACNGGGGHHGDDDDVVPVPANVQVTSGYQSAQLTWDAVTGATGYRVYVTDNPKDTGGTPVDVAASPYDATGLQNWRDTYFRVSALKQSLESARSARVTALPTAGWVVASRSLPSEISLYHSDEPNIALETVASATFTDTLLDAAGTRLGMVYGKFATAGIYYELGVFQQATRAILGAEPGHTYRYLGLIDGTPRRAVFVDTVGADVGVRTATLDGVEDHLVKSGCVNVTLPKFSPAGVIFVCEEAGAVKKVYYTDGVAPAVFMTGTNRAPLALTATHAITGDTNLGLVQLHTQALAGALGGTVQPAEDLFTSADTADGGEDSLLAVNPDGMVLARTFTAAQALPWETWTANVDLSVIQGTATRYRSFMAPLFIELSPDGTQAAVIYQSMGGAGQPHKGAVISLALPNSGAAPFNPLYLLPFPATESVSDVHFLSGGKFAGTWGPQSATISLNVHNADGTIFSTISTYPGSNFVDTKDDYLLYVGNNPQLFKSSLFDATSDLNLSLAAQQPLPTLRSDGYVTFVDDANFAWIASTDPTIPSALRLQQQIDAVPTDAVLNVGDGVGNRVFLTLYRSNGDRDVVMFDLDDKVTTPIVSGATYDTGYFFPN